MIQIKGKIGERLHQPWFGSGIGAVLVPILGLCLLRYPVGNGLINLSYDLPALVRPDASVTNIVIVKLDDVSYAELHQAPTDFDRGLHAKLLDRLRKEEAKLVVFDILFIDPTCPEKVNSDYAFRTAISNFHNVVLCSKADGTNKDKLIEPLKVFKDVARGLGLATVHGDTDNECRCHYDEVPDYPSLAWAAAEAITNVDGGHQLERWLNYYSRDPFTNISYAKAVSNEPFDFKGKYVFVGAWENAGYKGDFRETFRNPWTSLSSTNKTQGVEVHALTFWNLINGDWLRRLPGAVESLIIVILGALLGYGLSRLRPLWATIVAIVFSLAVGGAAYFMFASANSWFPWMIVVGAQVPFALGWSYVADSVRSYVEQRLLVRSLELYLSKKQVKEILKRPELLQPGGKQMTVSMMFTDIENFAKISGMVGGPNALLKLINDYYKETIGCIHETDGAVLQLVGDAILAIWNAPQEQTNHQYLACRAAKLLHERVIQFNAKSGELPLRTRMGLHSGSACVGNIGGPTHFAYTALGDEVNMTSRLEGLNKQLGTNILATHEVQQEAESAGLKSRLVGYFKFKGVVGIQKVYQLGGPAEVGQPDDEWRRTFAEGLRVWEKQFKRREVVPNNAPTAEDLFKKTLELRPDDGPSAFYLKILPEFKRRHEAKMLPEDWEGEVDLSEK